MRKHQRDRAALLIPRLDAALVPEASHLLPMGRPGLVAAAIEEFLQKR